VGDRQQAPQQKQQPDVPRSKWARKAVAATPAALDAVHEAEQQQPASDTGAAAAEPPGAKEQERAQQPLPRRAGGRARKARQQTRQAADAAAAAVLLPAVDEGEEWQPAELVLKDLTSKQQQLGPAVALGRRATIPTSGARVEAAVSGSLSSDGAPARGGPDYGSRAHSGGKKAAATVMHSVGCGITPVAYRTRRRPR
jgi:hypothetical protein